MQQSALLVMARALLSTIMLVERAAAFANTNIFATDDCEVRTLANTWCLKPEMVKQNQWDVYYDYEGRDLFTYLFDTSQYASAVYPGAAIEGEIIPGEQGHPPPTWAALSRACSDCCRQFINDADPAVSLPYYYSIASISSEELMYDNPDFYPRSDRYPEDTWQRGECRCCGPENGDPENDPRFFANLPGVRQLAAWRTMSIQAPSETPGSCNSDDATCVDTEVCENGGGGPNVGVCQGGRRMLEEPGVPLTRKIDALLKEMDA